MQGLLEEPGWPGLRDLRSLQQPDQLGQGAAEEILLFRGLDVICSDKEGFHSLAIEKAT